MNPNLDRGGIPRELTRLDAGDVIFEGIGREGPCVVGIERKAIKDLITSIRRPRLAGLQIPNMQEAGYEHNWIIVEGRFRAGGDGILEVPIWDKDKKKSVWGPLEVGSSRFMYSEVDNALTTFEMFSGLHYKRAYDIYETNRIVIDLYNWFNKPWEKHHAHKQFWNGDEVDMWKPSLIRRIANQLPGVGLERSGAVEKQFKSVREMILADAKEWRKVEGIGKKIAADIVQEVSGDNQTTRKAD